MYYIPQITNSDCLFTAFKMLLANVKGNKNYLFIQEDEKHGPYSLLEIIEMGKSYGLDMVGFKVDDKRELYKSGGTPMILNLKRGGNLHSVYVYKVTNKKVYYLDSDVGKVTIPLERFVLIWDGTGLMLRKIYDSQKKIELFQISTKKSIVGKIFQAICTVCFALALFFIGNNDSFIIPVAFILIGFLFDVLTKIVDLNQMKSFDNKTVEYLERIKSKNFSDFLPRRESLKQSIFSPKNNYFYYLLCSMFVIFVILTSNPLNIGCIFLPIILAVFQSLVIAPFEKKKNFEIEQKEVKFSKERGCGVAAKTLRQIQKEVYKFSNYYAFKTGLGIFLFIICSLLTLGFQNSITLLNLCFLTFTEIFLYQNLIPILTFESRKNELNANYMRFINMFQ